MALPSFQEAAETFAPHVTHGSLFVSSVAAASLPPFSATGTADIRVAGTHIGDAGAAWAGIVVDRAVAGLAAATTAGAKTHSSSPSSPPARLVVSLDLGDCGSRGLGGLAEALARAARCDADVAVRVAGSRLRHAESAALARALHAAAIPDATDECTATAGSASVGTPGPPPTTHALDLSNSNALNDEASWGAYVATQRGVALVAARDGSPAVAPTPTTAPETPRAALVALAADGDLYGSAALLPLWRGLGACRFLASLSLCGCGLSNESARALAQGLREAPALHALRTLRLARNAIGSDGLKALAAAIIVRYEASAPPGKARAAAAVAAETNEGGNATDDLGARSTAPLYKDGHQRTLDDWLARAATVLTVRAAVSQRARPWQALPLAAQAPPVALESIDLAGNAVGHRAPTAPPPSSLVATGVRGTARVVRAATVVPRCRAVLLPDDAPLPPLPPPGAAVEYDAGGLLLLASALRLHCDVLTSLDISHNDLATGFRADGCVAAAGHSARASVNIVGTAPPVPNTALRGNGDHGGVTEIVAATRACSRFRADGFALTAGNGFSEATVTELHRISGYRMRTGDDSLHPGPATVAAVPP